MTVTALTTPTSPGLSRKRQNLMRGGYLFVGAGLAVVKWPLLPKAHTMPLYEGVTLCLLTAMSLLFLIGAFRPLQLLPVLVLETIWKVLWLSIVALPRAANGRLNDAATDVAFNCSLVVLVIAVTPWDVVWRRYLRGGDVTTVLPRDSAGMSDS